MNRRCSSRNFSGVTYITVDDLTNLFNLRSNQIKHFAFIVHDCDQKEDSEETKTKHIHFVIELLYNCALTSVISWFSKFTEEKDGEILPITTLVEIAHDKCACYRYLIHFDDPDKFQYDVSMIHSDDIFYYKTYLVKADENRTYQLLMDIISKKPYLYMVKNYGRDYVLNVEKYENMADLIQRQLAYKKG